MGAQDTVMAALYMMAKEQFHILECEALAKTFGAGNRMTFDLVGPKGRMPCRWVDASYGIFERTDHAGHAAFHTKQFQYVADVHCENLENFS